MNTLEQRMLDILRELKEQHGAVSLRAEFEAEGTKVEELLRLKELSMAAELGLTLKIGGCESVRDLLESLVVGVDCLVAPMVESPYALRKYLQAVEKVLPAQERESIEILCNIETLTALQQLEQMLDVPEVGILNGIVIERVDLCFSLDLDERCINNTEVNELVTKGLTTAKNHRLSTTVGGGVGVDALPFFRSLPAGLMDRCETRKICFDYGIASKGDLAKGLFKALAFELLWLRNKLTYYEGIAALDRQRMHVIEEQYWKIINA